MTKSERVNLIQKLTAKLLQERPEVSDLTLAEFGVRTDDIWDGSQESYFINMLRGATNEALHELATHLNVVDLALPTDPEADRRLWTAGFCRCFLSHTSKHKKQAAELKVTLEQYGCDVFVAHQDIEPTLEWLREIEVALGSCHCLLALVTDDFHKSMWTDQEVGFVLGRGLPVIPIRAGNDPYGLMGKLQAISYNEARLSDVAESIFTSLNNKTHTAQFVASGAVQAFLNSNSFVMAKARMGIVERLASITPELRQRLSEAVGTNNQIRDAFGVPDRLNSLLKVAD